MSEPPKCPRCGAVLPAGVLHELCPACLLTQGVAADTATQPESPPAEALPIAEVARLFPQLEIIELLGKGGMGAVYKARQPALDRFVALKILPRQTGEGGPFAERFNREARALARLSHPAIVAVHDFGQTDGVPWFLMEFVDGVNLRQLERTRQLTPREALQLIPQICDALQYAHDEGVVHRDIKPENVLVDRKGRVKIADFGLARILGTEMRDPRLTGEGQVMGTPHYMAPEQVEHPLEVDHRADIYALGVVFYEMLTGELPLGRFQPPSRRVQVDVRLDDVVLRALEKEPALRYQQASEVKTDVESISRSPDSSRPSADSPPVRPGASAGAVGLDGGAARRLHDLERRRKAVLWYGFIVSLFGVPMGFALNLPLVWGLGFLGIVVGGGKLGLWRRLSERFNPRGTGDPPVAGGRVPSTEHTPQDTRPADHGSGPPAAASSARGQQGDASEARRATCPTVLWITLGVLLLTFIAKLVIGPRSSPWMFCDLLLLLGLGFRLKAAWVATLFFAALGVFAAMMGRSSGVAVGVLLLNALVAVPVWLSTPWFFPGPLKDLPRRRNEALRGLLFLLPPMLFTSMLLGDVFHLDIDAQFYAALMGLPLAAGLGAALVWASTLLHPDADCPPRSPEEWSWRAIGSAALLVLNLPLAATALLMIRSIARDPDWNPAPAEAFFAFGVLGGGSLLALGSLLLGIMARRKCRHPESPRRGGWLAWAGVWFWPALLVAALMLKTHRVDGSTLVTSEEARLAEAVLEQEITARAADLGWRFDGVAVQVSGLPPSVSCYLGQGVRDDGIIPVPFNASVRITPGASGRWQVHGQGDLEQMRFWVELPESGRPHLPAADRSGFSRARTAVLSTAVASQLQDCFLDLDTGCVLSAPPVLVREMRATGQLPAGQAFQLPREPLQGWLRNSHVDVVFRPGLEGVTLLDGVAIATARRQGGLSAFDSVEAANVRAFSKNMDENFALLAQNRPNEPVLSGMDMSEKGNTWLFRSLDGKAGVIEITDVRDEGREVWLRWKLLVQAHDRSVLPEKPPSP